MNSKGFKNFNQGMKFNKFSGSNPMAMLPLLLIGGGLMLAKDCIYYGR